MKLRTSIRLVAAGAVLAAIGLAIREVRLRTAPEAVRQSLLKNFNEALDADFAVESARFEFDGRVEAGPITVSAPGLARPVLECPRTILQLDLWQMLHLNKVLRRCAVLSPTIRLLYDPERSAWNFQTIEPRPGDGAAREGFLADGVEVRDATLQLRHGKLFDDDATRTYEGIDLRLVPGSGANPGWNFSGIVAGGPVRGVRLHGYFDADSDPPLKVTYEARGLRADKALWQLVPRGGLIWQRYRPVGDVSVSGLISQSPGRKTQYRCQVELHGLTANAPFLPRPAQSVRGTVVVSNRGVSLRNLTGVIPARELDPNIETPYPVQFRVEGEHRNHRESDYHVEVTDVPICRATLEAIPDVGQQIWERLRPRGRCDVSLRLSRQREGQPLRPAVTVRLHDGTVHLPELPRPLHNVNGTIRMEDGVATFHGLRAVLPAGPGTSEGSEAASVWVDGRLDDDGAMALDIRFHNLSTDRELVRKLDEGGEIWGTLQPTVILDGRLLLERERDDAPLEPSGLLTVHGGRLQPRSLPVPFRDVTGTIRVDGRDQVFLERLAATAQLPPDTERGSGANRVEISGPVDLAAGRAELTVVTRGVNVGESLLKALPRVGEKIWDQVQPTGLVSAEGKVSYDANREGGPLTGSGVLTVHGARARPKAFPVPFKDVTGAIRIEGLDNLFLERLTATAELPADPDHGRGANHVEISGPLDPVSGRADLTVKARNVNVGERLLKAVPHVGEVLWTQAQPRGLASLSGRVSYDKGREKPVDFLLETEFYEVNLEPAGLDLPIKALAGRALISDTQAVSDDFTAIACHGQVSGSLVTRYGASGEYPTCAATLRLRRLDLSQLPGVARGQKPEAAGLISGVVEMGGVLGSRAGLGAEGTLTLEQGRLWNMPFFGGLVNVLHLQLTAPRETSQEGEARFRYVGGEVDVERFEVTGGGLDITGHGTINRDRELDMILVVVGTESRGKGIPIISRLVGWLMRAAEGELFRVNVSGTIDEPKYSPEFLGYITWPLTSLRNVFRNIIYGSAQVGD